MKRSQPGGLNPLWVLSPLLFAILASSLPLFWAVSLVQAYLFTMCGILVARFGWPRRELGGLIPIAVALGLCAVGLIQLAAESTAVRSATWNAILTWASYAALLLITGYCSRSQLRDALFQAALPVGAIASLLCMGAYYTSPHRILWIFPVPYENTYGPYIYRNFYACFVELVTPSIVYLGMTEKRRKLFCGICLSLLICSLVICGSRMGCILVGAEVLLILLLGVGRGLVKGWALAQVAGLVLIAGAVAVSIVGTDQIGARFREPHPYRVRKEILSSSVEMIRERPALGWGMGTWRTVYPSFAHFDPGVLVNEAHNDWAQITADGGIPAFALLFLLFVFSVSSGLRTLFGIGAAFVLVHAFVDYPLEDYSIALLLILMASLPEPAASSSRLHSESGLKPMRSSIGRISGLAMKFFQIRPVR